MQFIRPVLLIGLAASTGFGASKEIIQIQRDIAQLQDQVQTLQRTVDERVTRLTTLVEQALAAANKSNTAMAVMESGLRDRLAQQLTAPVATLGTKVDQMSSDFAAVRESVADLNERIGKLQLQITDLSNTVKVLQTPPAPPPSAAPQGGAGAPAAGPPQGLSAVQLYETAQKDKRGGNLDLAAQGFQEYLKWFPNTDLAPNAQFALGEILMSKSDYQGAIQAFDAVLERFPENNKTPDALYMKGAALLRAGQRNQAAQEFLAVVQKYPTSQVAVKAREQRKALGLSSPSAAGQSRRRR